MPIFHCPRCNVRLTTTAHTGDFVHKCNSGIAALDNEDIPRIGRADKGDGTTTDTPSAQGLAHAGAENILQGSRAQIEGASLGDLTERGKRKSTHWTRPHFESIDKPV